jgi:hypothetical protein
MSQKLSASKDDDTYSAEETASRRDEVIRRMANTPPQPKVSHPQKKAKKAVAGPKARKSGRAGKAL